MQPANQAPQSSAHEVLLDNAASTLESSGRYRLPMLQLDRQKTDPATRNHRVSLALRRDAVVGSHFLPSVGGPY